MGFFLVIASVLPLLGLLVLAAVLPLLGLAAVIVPALLLLAPAVLPVLVRVVLLVPGEAALVPLLAVDPFDGPDRHHLHLLKARLVVHQVPLSGAHLPGDGDLLELLDLSLQPQVGALQVLDELVLRLHH